MCILLDRSLTWRSLTFCSISTLIRLVRGSCRVVRSRPVSRHVYAQNASPFFCCPEFACWLVSLRFYLIFSTPFGYLAQKYYNSCCVCFDFASFSLACCRFLASQCGAEQSATSKRSSFSRKRRNAGETRCAIRCCFAASLSSYSLYGRDISAIRRFAF